jgi:NADH:ubiquinone oxidoreductase subunit E
MEKEILNKDINDKIGAVAVIGGGIGGMQAALDLAEQGFKVYLLEEKPSIGGAMAQLDKTFPTNDCAMCTMAPRLVEIGRHPNIELITKAEVEGLSGQAGRFTLIVKKKPTFVDPEKCTGCGICQQNCPVRYKIYLEPEEKIEVKLSPEDLEKMNRILRQYRDKKDGLMPILRETNTIYRYLPENVLRFISEELDIPLSIIYRIATFYNAFSLVPRGEHIINVCLGTTCYVRGSKFLIDRLTRELNIEVGQTTQDLKFTLETVRCLGCCSLAPVMTVDGETYGRLKQQDIPKILEDYA